MRHSVRTMKSRVLTGILVVLALGLTGCEAKLDDFFAPATEIPGGGGDEFPTAADLDDLAVSVNYTTISTTCEASLAPFSANASLFTVDDGSVTLDVLFQDASTPISGQYLPATGMYAGETGPVDIGSGAFANEQWSASFVRASSNTITMTGTSTVDVTGSFSCQRVFTIGFSKTF